MIERGGGWELRLGRWQDVLADVECDALITDPPYDARTHGSYSDGHSGWSDRRSRRASIGYDPLSESDVVEIVESWSPRTRGWMMVMTSHGLTPAYLRAMESASRYVFAPIPLVETGGRVRMAGDGPSSWTCWCLVARPRSREWLASRAERRRARGAGCALPGAYVQPAERSRIVMGGKPLAAMREIIDDYSEPDDLVCDPYAGGATTLVASVQMGRRAIGAEIDPETFAAAVERLRSAERGGGHPAQETMPW